MQPFLSTQGTSYLRKFNNVYFFPLLQSKIFFIFVVVAFLIFGFVFLSFWLTGRICVPIWKFVQQTFDARSNKVEWYKASNSHNTKVMRINRAMPATSHIYILDRKCAKKIMKKNEKLFHPETSDASTASYLIESDKPMCIRTRFL